MSVSKAQILSLCSKLDLDLADSTSLSAYFDSVVKSWGMLPNPPFQAHAFVSLTAGTAIYDYETDMIRPISSYFNDKQLFYTSEDSLSAYNRDWRTDSGEPLALTTEDLLRQYRLWPEPDTTTTGIGGAEPFGEDYPSDVLFMHYSQDRDALIREIYQFPLIFQIFSYEFSYDSQHQDIDFAELCGEISKFFLSILGN